MYAVRGQGTVSLNGTAAHLGEPGGRLTIMNLGLFEPAEAVTHRPRVIVLGDKNEVLRQK